VSQIKLNKKLKILFKDLKINKSDKIIIHTNIAGLSQFYKKDKEGICKIFISFLKKYIGKKGAIIIPTYNYQFTKNKHFDIQRSSSEVGFFSNYLLKRNWKKRTFDPVFSHIIFDKKDNFNYKKINTEAFGKNSIFSYLIKKNYKIICFCCSSNNITFLHYLEYLFEVPYRYIKKFKGTVVYNNFKSQISYKYNVGRKSCDYSFKENAINKLINQKNFIKSYFGKFECYSVTSKYLYNNLKKKINLNKKFLILQ
jgi:aminoglycoside 3-N-acetyltransferase